MTLNELAGEYLKDEERLTRQIRQFLPAANSMTGAKRHEAKRRLLCLYEMRREVRVTAKTLREYYAVRTADGLPARLPDFPLDRNAK